MGRRGQALLGLAGVAVLLALGVFVNFYLGGGFKRSFRVDAIFTRAGQNLRDGSDVKVRGVLVGTIRKVEQTDDGKARVVMAMQPSQKIPDNVTAVIRAKTLFGEKYVELRVPQPPSAEVLADGDEIGLDRTTPPLEVEDVLGRAVPLLDAVDPTAFAAALQALAQAFTGNEELLRRATLQGEQALTGTQSTLPQLERNLQHLQSFSAALDRSDTDLLRALDSLEKAGRPIISGRGELETIFRQLTPLMRDLGDVLIAREKDLGDLSAKGADILDVVKAKAPQLPALVKLLDGFLGVWIADLSFGPYWRITNLVGTPPAGPYPPGTAPAPVSPASAGPRDEALRKLGGADPRSPGLVDVVLGALPTAEVEKLAGQVTSRR
ncbi:MAG: MCE family protein [Candidatus Limnocylindria bacterium]